MFLQNEEKLENFLKQAKAALEATAKKEEEEDVKEIKKAVAPAEEYDPTYVGDNALQTLIYHLKARNPDGSPACLVSDAVQMALNQIRTKEPSALLVGAAWKALGKTAAADAAAAVPESKLEELANMALANQDVRVAHPELQQQQLVESMKDGIKAEEKAEKAQEEDDPIKVSDSTKTDDGKKKEDTTVPASKSDSGSPSLEDLLGGSGSSSDNKEIATAFQDGATTDTEGVEEHTTGIPPVAPTDPAKTANESMFSYLSKTAEDTAIPQDQQLQAIGLTEPEKFFISVEVTNDTPAEQILDLFVKKYGDTHKDAAEKEIARQWRENTPQTVQQAIGYPSRESFASNMQERTAQIDSLLNAVASYKEEAPVEDKICDMAKVAATSEEFISKMANFNKEALFLDEDSGSPQHKGKEMFNGKYVTHAAADNNTPKFPGQKVFATREGGNPQVESVYTAKGKADVDVYNDQVGRKATKSIVDPKEGTIAFMQPFKVEGEDITLNGGFDYNGIVTGELQRTKDTKEKLAGAGHKTVDYLDKIDELADKKKVSGDLPKSAGFAFHMTKTAEDANASTGTIGNDNFNQIACGDKKKTLSPEDLMKAKSEIEDHEEKIEAAK